LKVLVVDDDALIRDSLELLLAMEEDIEVIGTAANGQAALELCKKTPPDIVLMDIRMPVMDGVLGTKVIKEQFPKVNVVILTTFRDDEYIKMAIKNGASGYILKSQQAESIVESLRSVAGGNTVLGNDVASTLSSMFKENKISNPADYQLTDREMEIMELVGNGLSNKEIAAKLYLGEGTVRNYIARLFDKLKLRDRTQLAIFYLKHFQ